MRWYNAYTWKLYFRTFFHQPHYWSYCGTRMWLLHQVIHRISRPEHKNYVPCWRLPMTDPTYPLIYCDYNCKFIIASTNKKARDRCSDVVASTFIIKRRFETYYKHMYFFYTILLRNKSYILHNKP